MSLDVLAACGKAFRILFAGTLALQCAHAIACSVAYPPGSAPPPTKKYIFTAVVEDASLIDVDVQGEGVAKRGEIVALLIRVRSTSTSEPAVGELVPVVELQRGGDCRRIGRPFDRKKYYAGKIVRVEADELPYVMFTN